MVNCCHVLILIINCMHKSFIKESKLNVKSIVSVLTLLPVSLTKYHI